MTLRADSWTGARGACRLRAGAWGRPMRVGGWSRLVGRARPALLTSFRPMTSRSASGLSCPICREARHGVAVTALKDSLYAIGGATAARAYRIYQGSIGARSLGPRRGDPDDGKPRVARAPRYAVSAAVRGRDRSGRKDVGSSVESARASPPVPKRRSSTGRSTPGGRVPSLPEPLHHFMAVTYKGEVVVIGGFVPGDELTSEQSDRVFALRDDAWEELPSLNHPRAAAAAAVVGDKIVVVGGQADGKLVPETEVFDGEGWKDVAEIPTPREHLGAASDGRFVYAVGGRSCLRTRTWVRLSAMTLRAIAGRSSRRCRLPPGAWGRRYAGGRVVAVGGESSTSASDVVQGYDIQKRQWSELPNLPEPRHGVAVTALNDSLYAIGGATTAGHVKSSRLADVLDFD